MVQLLPPISYDVCDIKAIEWHQGAYEETPFPLSEPDFPQLTDERIRKETFIKWPYLKPAPEELSEPGFFFTQKEDRVICFNCGGGLQDWTEEDNPWEQHACWYSECSYLRLKRGLHFIKNTKLKFNLKIKS